MSPFKHTQRTATGLATVLKVNQHLQYRVGSSYDAALPVRALAAGIRLRVTPDDGGPEFESKASARGADVTTLIEGRFTYICYDPEHPDECEFDLDRMEKQFGRTPDGHKRWTVPERWVRQGDQIASPATPSPSGPTDARDAGAPLGMPADTSTSAADDIAKLAELHARGILTDAEFEAGKQRLLGI